MIPKHVAIIMDGNGRWAKDKGLPREYGHQNGVNSVKSIVEEAYKSGIQYLTLYAFSIENWGRPSDEISILMSLLVSTLRDEFDEIFDLFAIRIIVEKKDLITSGDYAEKRKELRKKLLEYKKNRRVAIGPYATFYFESFETMLAQVQEMLHIEKGGEEQLKDELNAYNPLIPKGKELVATLMFEIDNPILRADFLEKVGGIENKVYMKIDEEKVIATPETDVDRTSAEGKASSVQFTHFKFTDDQIKKFKDSGDDVKKQKNGFFFDFFLAIFIFRYFAAISSKRGDYTVNKLLLQVKMSFYIKIHRLESLRH